MGNNFILKKIKRKLNETKIKISFMWEGVREGGRQLPAAVRSMTKLQGTKRKKRREEHVKKARKIHTNMWCSINRINQLYLLINVS